MASTSAALRRGRRRASEPFSEPRSSALIKVRDVEDEDEGRDAADKGK